LHSAKSDLLKEFSRVRQIRDQGFRRWFSSSSFDLIVWYEDDQKTLRGFQLCYDENHAITWTHTRGYEHHRVDTGDVRTPSGTGMTPILLPDGAFDAPSIAERFRRASIRIEKTLADFVYGKLRTFPEPPSA